MARQKKFDEKVVLEKAVNLFWIKGYNATTAQDLVDGLGISRSSLYDTYVDKRTLFKRSLKQYQEKNTNAVLKMLNKSKNSEQTIKQIFENIIKESIIDTLSKGCFMVNTAVELGAHDAEIWDIVTQNNQSVEDALTKIVEKGQQSGVFSLKRSPRSLARFLFGNITALRVVARSGAKKDTLDDIVDVTLAALK